MNETFIIVFLIVLAFVMGVVPVLLIGRGLFMLYIKAFISGRVIAVVHLKRSDKHVFRLCSNYDGASVLKYSLASKKDVHSVSAVDGSVVRGGLVSWIHVKEGSTSPFVFKKVVPIKEDEGVTYYAFEGFQDSGVIKQLYDWALMRPKLMAGNIPIMTIIIGLVIVVAVILVITQLGGGAENVI